ncbi:MAG: ATP-binding cassette domain-containing protein [Candidatus Dadabacteria bacterium]|nr:MAG: ATP-binding cassette domain-containing protein [Candidatus Dadabacteria bacterium]
MKEENKVTFKRLLGLLKPHTGRLLAGLVALVLASSINLLFPEIIRRVLNSDGIHYLYSHPWQIAALLIALFALQSLCFYARSYIFSSIGQRITKNLRTELYDAIIRQQIAFFDSRRTGDLISRLSSDTVLIQDAISIRLSVFIRYGFQVVVGTILMAMLSIKLTLGLILALPVIVGISVVLGKKLRSITRTQQKRLGKATTIAEETFQGVRIVKAFGRERDESLRYGSAAEAVLQTGLSRARVAAFFASFVSFLMNAAIVLVMIYGVVLISSGELELGDLTAFLLYGLIVAISFSFISAGYSEFMQALGALERVFEIIDTKPSKEFSPGVKKLSEPLRGEVVLDKVCFAYPSRPEVRVLHEVSFEIAAGRSTALVGPSGSGKSTIINLILRFYEPDSGVITFDGINISELDVAALRAAIAIVPQDPQLFALSVADNLRYGNPSATLDELREAAERARILDFIETLPDGFETNVGDRGLQLSAGQKQRIAIARAMLRDPRLLILDEATSALDSENEFLVQQALSELLKGRTALIIAHRLATIKNADAVVVLEHGRVIQRGTHASLATESGLYKTLVEHQNLLSS